MKPRPLTPIRKVLPVLFLLIASSPLWAIILYSILFHSSKLNNELIIILFLIAMLLGTILFTVYFYIVKTLHQESKALAQEIHDLGNGIIPTGSNENREPDFDDVNKNLTATEYQLSQKDLDDKKKFNEITQEKQIIKQDRDTLSVVLSGITHSVVATDSDKNVLFYNKAVEQVTGKPFKKDDHLALDDLLHFYDGNEQITSDLYLGQSENIAQKFKENGLELKDKDDKKKIVALTTAPLTFQNGQAGWMVNFHDISQQVESDVMKIDFVSMAAHELRTPLTSVRGYASLLKMEKWNLLDDGGKTLVDRLMISSEILSNFIENLLNVTRIEQNRFVLQTKPVDLTNVIKDTVTNLMQQATTKNQKLELKINGTLPVVLADAFRINQVLTNLIANAIHYTLEGGSITVIASEKDGYLQVEVSDTGQGIPADALPKLFTKFFRVSGVLEQGTKGTGLGLFISKSIIEMHKGKIWVTSVAGKGSTFTFILPKADEQILKE